MKDIHTPLEEALMALLRTIVEDATGGEAGTPDESRRVWPIRMDNYRAAKTILAKVENHD